MQFATIEPTRAQQRLSWIFHLALLTTLCAGAGLYAVSKGTDANWDLKNYHLYSAYAFVSNRLFFDIAPSQLQTYLNPTFNLITYYFMVMLDDHPRLFAFTQGLPAGIYGFFLFRIGILVASATLGRTLLAYACAVVATALGLTGAGFAAVVGTSTNDIITGTLCLAALAIVIGEMANPSRRHWRLALSGILAGIALGAKLTAVMYFLPLGLVVLTTLGFRAAFAFGLSAAVPFLAVFGPHAWKLWSATGNPLFPVYNDIFKSPDWVPLAIFGDYYLPRSLLEFVFYPFVWAVDQTRVTELTMRDLRLSILYCALAVAPVTAFAWRFAAKSRGPDIPRSGNARMAMALIGFIIVSYVIWARAFGIYRYLIVLESLAGVGLLVAGAAIFRRSGAMILAFLLAVLLVANVWITRPDWGHVDHAYRVIDIEPLPISAGALVVIADNSPHGYLVPFLPAGVRVVSINNNFIHPGEAYRLNTRIGEIIGSHMAAIAVISSPNTAEAKLQGTLAHYHLRAEGCAVVRSNIELQGHRICNAVRF